MTRSAHALMFAAALAGCSHNPNDRISGQTEFISAPLAGASRGQGASNGAGGGAGGSGGTPAANPGTTTTPPRTVEETDLYRLDGTRLYYLNGYRGLMVFDVSDVDHPKLLGRSAIYGTPVEMLVRNGVAVIVVADWFGALDDGTPFHGSIVRGLDASDPTNIRSLGEAKLGGWVRDTRVVGDVLYAVSEDYGWVYGWGDSVGGGGVAVVGPGTTSQPTETVIVSSVSFANNRIQAVGQQSFPGYSGIFNVTPSSILMAHDPGSHTAQTELIYLDISDPAGAIVRRGSLVVDGRAQGWGADNGRWNLDFADGKTAHLVGCAGGQWGCDNQSGYLLDTVDFSNPDAPVQKSKLAIPGTGWSVAARFDSNRLYLSPESYSYGSSSGTPFQVYDTSDPSAPKLAGSAMIPGTVWNILPAPQQRIFALGNDWSGQSGSGDSVSLKYLDVTNPSSPQLLGTSTFGQGWAWTPAAGTFKAFTMDATKGLVVLPFSGWSSKSDSYNNGLQLIEFTPTTTRTAGAAKTRGWVERGIFVGTRLVSLSDLALSVVDYSNHDAPTVTAELTLARNVIAAQPGGATIAEISSDWWDNDVTSSEVRVLPIANAEETGDSAGISSVAVDGVNARVFRNGDLQYVVTNVRVPVACGTGGGPGIGPQPGGGGGAPQCYGRAEQIQVVDLAGGGATLRGKVRLPVDNWGYGWWGWWGFYWYDWYDGAEALQVGKDALAFRRWQPVYDGNGYYLDGASALYVVDLANADAPSLASVTVTTEHDGWWGNMRVVGDTLYTTHYEWFQKNGNPDSWSVKYYASRIDLSDKSHPRVESKINVPGLIVGGSDVDPSLLYTIDYRWDGNLAKNDFDVVRLHGHVAELLSKTTLDGWVGSTFIRGSKAYLSAQQYDANGGYGTSHVNLHAIDLSKPTAPVDHVASGHKGWGWLLGVEGDRAIVSSGWGQSGVDIYQLSDGAAPQFSQFARTRGWWTNAITRQDNALYLSSGYWGVQRIDLK